MKLNLNDLNKYMGEESGEDKKSSSPSDVHTSSAVDVSSLEKNEDNEKMTTRKTTNENVEAKKEENAQAKSVASRKPASHKPAAVTSSQPVNTGKLQIRKEKKVIVASKEPISSSTNEEEKGMIEIAKDLKDADSMTSSSIIEEKTTMASAPVKKSKEDADAEISVIRSATEEKFKEIFQNAVEIGFKYGITIKDRVIGWNSRYDDGSFFDGSITDPDLTPVEVTTNMAALVQLYDKIFKAFSLKNLIVIEPSLGGFENDIRVISDYLNEYLDLTKKAYGKETSKKCKEVYNKLQEKLKLLDLEKDPNALKEELIQTAGELISKKENKKALRISQLKERTLELLDECILLSKDHFIDPLLVNESFKNYREVIEKFEKYNEHEIRKLDGAVTDLIMVLEDHKQTKDAEMLEEMLYAWRAKNKKTFELKKSGKRVFEKEEKQKKSKKDNLIMAAAKDAANAAKILAWDTPKELVTLPKKTLAQKDQERQKRTQLKMKRGILGIIFG